MPVQLITSLGNARLSLLKTTIGSTSTLQIRSGTKPANCAAADTGTLLASVALPTDWIADPVNSVMNLSAELSDLAIDASGTAGHFRIKDSSGVCVVQGTIGTSSADMILNTVNLLTGGVFTLKTFTIYDAP
jgi:hypothetical protein